MDTLPIRIALRYLFSKKSTNAINIIAWISVVAVAVVTMSLLVVFSVFNGFEGLVRSLYSDFYADVRIAPTLGKRIHVDSSMFKALQHTEGIAAVSGIAEEKAIVVNENNQAIVIIKGVDENFLKVCSIVSNNHIIKGNYDLGTATAPKLCLGLAVAGILGIDIDKNTLASTIYMPGDNFSTGQAQDFLNSFHVIATGAFAIQQDFDSKYAITNVAFVKYMLGMQPDEYSSIELRLSPGADANKVVAALKKTMQGKAVVETREQQNHTLFSAMQVEKWIIYAITILILAIASFNIIGAFSMLVLEKQRDMAILKALGASETTIVRIFLWIGLFLAIIGTVIGALIGTAICLVQIYFHFIKLSGGTFIIDYYPVKLLASDFFLVIITVFLICYFAALVPAYQTRKRVFSLRG